MRPADAEGLWRDLRRVAFLVEQVRDALGREAAQVDQALALLEEAQRWLPRRLRARPPKLRPHPYRFPEAVLYFVRTKLGNIRRRLEREGQARRASWEVTRVLELVREACAHLEEAWLAYLYAHEMPQGFRPVRALPLGGGLVTSLLTAFVAAVGGAYVRDVSPKVSWLGYVLTGFWAGLGAWVLRGYGYPRRSQRGPRILARGAIPRRLALLALVLAGVPFLGILFRPYLIRFFMSLSLVGLTVALGNLLQSLRLLAFPPEARVLLIPGYFLVFAPRVLKVSERKIFPAYV